MGVSRRWPGKIVGAGADQRSIDRWNKVSSLKLLTDEKFGKQRDPQTRAGGLCREGELIEQHAMYLVDFDLIGFEPSLP